MKTGICIALTGAAGGWAGCYISSAAGVLALFFVSVFATLAGVYRERGE